MRVVVFASGSEYSRVILNAIAERQTIAAVVTPAARGSLLRRMRNAFHIWRAGRAFRREVRRRGFERIAFGPAPDGNLTQRLKAMAPDLIVVAAFPYRIPVDLCRLAKLGALNVHPSLLPRHRGAEPLFWTFFHDDAITGSTVHWIVDALDAGDIVRQESLPVRRGVSYAELSGELARLGGKLAVQAIDDIEAGRARRSPQSEESATTEPLPSAAAWSVDFQTWPAERLWHFLSGISASHPWAARRIAPLRPPVDFTIAPPALPPGQVERTGDTVRIYTTDGWVTARAIR